jgi:uncharacterized membrane protein
MDRPKIILKKTRLDKSIELLTFFLILVSIILISIFFSQLPQKIPIYFNWPTKDQNGLCSKDVLWAGPIILGLLAFGIFKLNQYPWIFNYPITINEGNAKRQYRIATQLLRWLNLLLGLLCIILVLLSLSDGLKAPLNP